MSPPSRSRAPRTSGGTRGPRTPSQLTRALAALRESEERYRRLFDDDLTGDSLTDPRGRIVTCNPAFLRIFGFASRKQAVGSTIARLYPSPADYRRFLDLLRARGKLERYECVRVRRDGTPINVVENAVASFDPAGRLQEIKSYVFEETEQKRAEAALRESEERYRRLFEDDLTGDCLTDPEGRIVTCNPAFLQIFGFASREEALGSRIARLYPSPAEYAHFVDLLRVRGKLEGYQCVRVRLDGTAINVVENAVASFDPAGRLQEIKSYVFDDTERKRAEAALEEAKERYRLLVELIPDAVLVSDEETIWFANLAAARLVGAERADALVGRGLLAIFHADYHGRVLERTRLALTTNAALPLERRKLVRLDGGLVDVETTVGPCVYDGKPGVVRVIRDITERVRYEEELLQKDREISLHAEKVERLNAALRVLLDHREQESRQKDENMRATLDKLVLPYLASLKGSRLTEAQQGFVEILETNLGNISSSFARALSTWHEKLTPTEIQVADMVLAGKRSKEIAGLLRISESAVAFHRANIRNKLGLKKQSVNLVSYLRSISKKQ
jgi:PAS domain S-box-containing protein